MHKKQRDDKEQVKFQYTIEWQWDLLRFITLDRDGYKALLKIKDHYFMLIEHQVLATCLIKHYKDKQKIPGETILREEVVSLLNSKEYIKLITKTEQEEVLKLIPKLYMGILKDSSDIYEMCKKFSSYIRLKELLEEVDPTNWEQYNRYQQRFSNAIEDEDEQLERKSSLLLGNLIERQLRRKDHKPVLPTPFRQINQLTNAGGFEKGSIIVLLDKEKQGKTMVLVNIAKGYLRQKKKILYLDFENGRDAILTRFEQSINNLTKKEILDGDHDDKVKQKFRKYKRLGGEVVVERLPAGSNCSDIQRLMDKYYREYGLKFDILIGDYLAKMGSLSGKKDDTERISDVYTDVGNLAIKNNIDSVWTANHVTRDGAKLRMKTRYESIDIAKCIDIVRHVGAIFGLNRTKDEEEAGFLRLEVVEQRDGIKGRAVFTVDHSKQTLKELTKSERQHYDEEFWSRVEDEDEGPIKDNSKKIEKAKDDFKS